MRVGLVIYENLDSVSGGYLYDRMLVQYLRHQGDEIRLLSIPWRNYPRHLSDNFSLRLLDRLNDLSPDVLLQDELNHPSLFLLNRRLRRRIRCPIVSIVHHLKSSEPRSAWQNRFYRWVECRYLKTVDGFVCNSETTRGVVQSLLGEARPAVVARPGKDHLTPMDDRDIIARRCAAAGPLEILFIGNLIPRKGFHTLLEALEMLPRGSWRLCAAGSRNFDPGYVGRIRRMIERGKLDQSVELLGTVNGNQLEALLRAKHCLCVPSFYEGYGIVFVEAMGFGLPVVATTAGATPEIVTDGQEGLLVAPGNPEALAARLRLLSEDRRLLLDMSLRARERYGSEPTWNESAEKIRTFIQRLAEDGSRRKARADG